jgi:hypothetical protein
VDIGVRPGKLTGLLLHVDQNGGDLTSSIASDIEPALHWLRSVAFATSEESWREQQTAAEKMVAILEEAPAILKRSPAELDAVTQWLLNEGARTNNTGALLERCPNLWAEASIERMERRRGWLLKLGVCSEMLIHVFESCPECLSVDVSDAQLEASVAWLSENGVPHEHIAIVFERQPRIAVPAGGATLLQRSLLKRLLAVRK